ncbi:hypothetical protein NQT62_06980 [Limnobacter humi]|uniref:VOC family protein n=1 Tax=Limnobacter humi TaxID=1778671 RepID=A0ABT1WGM6_9BURK|nr:hypothetical protein [Limnobacter humi]
MLGYVTLGTDDLEKTSAFFDQLFQPLGAKRLLEVPGACFGASTWANLSLA